MEQLAVEEQFVAAVLQSIDYMIHIVSRPSTNFVLQITSKELKYMLNLALETYNAYSSLLTEQILVDDLSRKSASEEDILKYKFLFKQLKKKTISDTDFKFVVDRLSNSYISRSLIDGLLQTQELLQRDQNGTAAFEMLEKNMTIIKAQLADKNIREASTKNITDEYVQYQDMLKNPEKYRGVKVGVTKLDEITGGFRKGELIITMGATKVGKSIFLMNCQYKTVLQGLNSVFVTIEMSLEQCRRRLSSRLSGIPYLKIKNMNLSSEELNSLKSKLEEFEKLPGHSLIIDFPKNCTAKAIEAKLQMLLKTQKVDLVIIDYMLLMSPSIPSSKMNREERITQISLELKEMARTLNIPVITATQVNAAAEKEKKKDTDSPYEWYDSSQAKSIAANCDWLISLKRQEDIHILNLGIVVGRDGALDDVVPLVTDYTRMMIENYDDIIDKQIDMGQVNEGDQF